MAYKSESPYYPPPPPAKTIQPKHCTGCGLKLFNGQNFCPDCGTKVEPRELKNSCECGQMFGPTDKFCLACGKERPRHAGPSAPAAKVAPAKPKAKKPEIKRGRKTRTNR
jgi:predicted amidophosphoribosyltransferase